MHKFCNRNIKIWKNEVEKYEIEGIFKRLQFLKNCKSHCSKFSDCCVVGQVIAESQNRVIARVTHSAERFSEHSGSQSMFMGCHCHRGISERQSISEENCSNATRVSC